VQISSIRNIVTHAQEPPEDTPNLRPTRAVLIQDRDLYYASSQVAWDVEMGNLLTKKYGMSYGCVEMVDMYAAPSSEIGRWEQAWWHETQKDLAGFHDPASKQILLIARGPLVSWLSQLYLMKLVPKLSGLIMIDPLPLDSDDADHINKALDFLEDHIPLDNSRREVEFTRALYEDRKNQAKFSLEESDSKDLPKLVLHSFPDESFTKAAGQIALLHKTEGNEDIPVAGLEQEKLANRASTIDQYIETIIGPWIEQCDILQHSTEDPPVAA
jgi:hypothetical protein